MNLGGIVVNKGFFNFCSFKSKTKGLYENHNSLFIHIKYIKKTGKSYIQFL